ncbi:MAG TPA: hypothetical protein VEO01_09630 [Pseudonocardiaceae bacterium]|nr:hypothetical protein [Pseudonocardiaceae bacterium]
MAFLVIQSPNGEFRRFLIVLAAAVFVLLAAVGVMALAVEAGTAATVVSTAASAVGGDIVYRRFRRRRQ